MGEVSVTSASQILESLWNIWSHVTQQKEEPYLVFFMRMPLGGCHLARIQCTPL